MMKKEPEINPWRTTLSVPVREVYISESKGSRLIDTGNRASLYFQASTLALLTQLPASSKDMFFYICQHLNPNKETIELKYEVYSQRTGLSRKTFDRAIKGLINVLLIPKKSRSGTYFVNPAILFKGDRVSKFKEKVNIHYHDPRVLGMRKLGVLPELDLNFNEEAAKVDEKEDVDFTNWH